MFVSIEKDEPMQILRDSATVNVKSVTSISTSDSLRVRSDLIWCPILGSSEQAYATLWLEAIWAIFYFWA